MTTSSSATARSSTAAGSCLPAPASGSAAAASPASGADAARRRPGASRGGPGRAARCCRASSTRTCTRCSRATSCGRCDLRRRATRRGYLRDHRRLRAAIIPTRRGSPAAAGRWTRSPAACPTARRWTRSSPTARSSCRTATATAPGSTAGRSRWPGSTATPRTRPDGRIERDADGEPDRHAAGGRRRAWSRGCCPGDRGRLGPGAADRPGLPAARSASPAGRTRSSAAAHGDADPTRPPTCAPRGRARCAPTSSARCGGTGTAAWSSSPSCSTSAGRRRRPGGSAPTSVKMMLDGVAENHTAAMLEPYLDGHGCADRSQRPGLHRPGRAAALRDRAGPRGIPGALPRARRPRGAQRAGRGRGGRQRAANGAGPAARHHLAHLQVVHPDDVARFAALGATANIQPLWATHEPQMDELTIPFLGERRSAWQYPFRSLQDGGRRRCARAATGRSAAPTRCGARTSRSTGACPPTAGGRGRRPVPAASSGSAWRTILAAYTSGSARINGWTTVTGSVRAGLDADFAVVDADLSRIGDHEISQAAVTHDLGPRPARLPAVTQPPGDQRRGGPQRSRT